MEIELYSTRGLRIGAMLTWLRIGEIDVLEWAPGGYDSRRRADTYIAVLTAVEFAALPDRAPVGLMYGIPWMWS